MWTKICFSNSWMICMLCLIFRVGWSNIYFEPLQEYRVHCHDLKFFSTHNEIIIIFLFLLLWNIFFPSFCFAQLKFRKIYIYLDKSFRLKVIKSFANNRKFIIIEVWILFLLILSLIGGKYDFFPTSFLIRFQKVLQI